MTTTPHLGLPLIAAAQAQKHVTHNEALFGLDALVHLAVRDRDLATPPAEPDDGDRYIVADGAVGAWAGKGGQIAAWQDGAWRFYAPGLGWLAYVLDEGALLGWDGAAWTDAIKTITAFQNLTQLGVGTTADAANPFSAKLNDALWTARLVAEGGTGDLRYKLNKESAAGTLSLLFQDSYSGRAEIGLAGDDDFRIKVSADGAVWKDALRIDRSTGTVAFPAGAALPPAAAIAGGITNLVVNGNFAVNQRGYVSGVALTAGAFGHDRWKGGAAGCTYTFTPSPPNTTITITFGSLIQAIEDAQVEGGSYVLSWTGSAQGRVGHSGTAASGPYSASPIAMTGAGAGQQINIEFSSGTLGKVQLEPGTSATPFERRPISLTELLCKRYYEVGRFDHRGYGTAGTLIGAHIPHRVAKRTTPTIALSGIVYGNASAATADGIGTLGFRLLWNVVAAGAGALSGTWASSAEL